MIGIGQEGRYPCEFADFFRTTPQVLLSRKLYAEIANALHGGALRQASVVLLARSVQAVATGGVNAGEAMDEASTTERGRAARRSLPRGPSWQSLVHVLRRLEFERGGRTEGGVGVHPVVEPVALAQVELLSQAQLPEPVQLSRVPSDSRSPRHSYSSSAVGRSSRRYEELESLRDDGL
jgi:hypothetical protein